MKQALQLTTRQQLKMTPQLQQAIELLQLSALELELKIKEALEKNPMLESTDHSNSHDSSIYTDWSSVEVGNNYSNNSPRLNENDDFSSYTAPEVTLKEHLNWQLNLTPFSDTDRIIALTIIDSILDDGYLQTSLEEILEGLKYNHPKEFQDLELDEVTAVLHRIQQFDPIGVASRNLQECLLIQLNALPTSTYMLDYTKTIIIDYLDLLGQKQFAKLKNIFKINEQQLAIILKLIKHLHPYPGELISNRPAEYIVPDVIVSKNNNRWHVSLKTDFCEQVQINRNYADLVNRASSERDTQYLRTQLNEAKWLLGGIETRNKTLLKVASCILKQQQEFLEHGEEQMRPMILQDIASATGLNESTISRVTTKKYMHTPRGVFELKYFFSSHITNRAGHDCSSTAIKAIIKQLINKESVESPLSDQDISELMETRGLKVARRTVAKYRESLGIKSSSQRKKFLCSVDSSGQ